MTGRMTTFHTNYTGDIQPIVFRHDPVFHKKTGLLQPLPTNNSSFQVKTHFRQWLWDQESWIPSYVEIGKSRLDEIRNESEQACQIDDNIYKIPDEAYNDAYDLLEKIWSYNIPMPEFSWAEDGSLSFAWFFDKGRATIGLYGDNIVIFSIFFEDKRQAEGICELLDIPMLYGFFEILANIYRSEGLNEFIAERYVNEVYPSQ